ncbi:uncharacterized protein LOC128224505 [Mya arenaria]|uniref:uncharacterized protein LOC128224505 n=1 Tax=Mya arenaria TaxID=6604 RepID=UPI0022E242FF|nr:uncharacterized protein LOC128224505 [Mya arenaria]XP_052790326.1 uncharacterized protein LOC128224505 [Mya arenaria]
MTRSVFDTIRQILTCSICMEIFKDPRLLPCQHTLCRECLILCIKKGQRKGRSKTMFRCPMCRYEFDIDRSDPSSYKFSKNLTMKQFIDEFETHMQDAMDNQHGTGTNISGTQTELTDNIVTQEAETQTMPPNFRQQLILMLSLAIKVIFRLLKSMPLRIIIALGTLLKVIWQVVKAVIKLCCLPCRLWSYLLKCCFVSASCLLRKLRLILDILKTRLKGNIGNAAERENKTQAENIETVDDDKNKLIDVVFYIGIGHLLYFALGTSIGLSITAYVSVLFCVLVIFLVIVQSIAPDKYSLPIKRRRERSMAAQMRSQKRRGI